MKKLLGIFVGAMIIVFASCTNNWAIDVSDYVGYKIVYQIPEDNNVNYDYYVLKKDNKMQRITVPYWWSNEYHVGDTIK